MSCPVRHESSELVSLGGTKCGSPVDSPIGGNAFLSSPSGGVAPKVTRGWQDFAAYARSKIFFDCGQDLMSAENLLPAVLMEHGSLVESTLGA